MSQFVGNDKTGYPIVGVDYTELQPETYKGITVNYEGKETRIYSGNFIKDYDYVCMEYQPFYKSSSLDSFIEDSKDI